jgi:hypothetical protein
MPKNSPLDIKTPGMSSSGPTASKRGMVLSVEELLMAVRVDDQASLD